MIMLVSIIISLLGSNDLYILKLTGGLYGNGRNIKRRFL